MKEGWKICKIGDIAHIRRGLTYSKSDEVDNSNNIVLRSNNIDLSTNKLVYDELKFIHQSINIPEDKYLKKGELLMCMSNGSKVHLGKVALNEIDSIYVFGGFMAAISHDNSLIDKFFFYSLITPRFKEYIKSLSDGANINNLKARDIENYTIPIPPLPEQERIVSLLDAEFAKIDAIKANAEKQLQDAKALFQSALKDYLTPKEGWEEKRLDEICSKIIAGGDAPNKDFMSKTKTPDYPYPIFSNGVENRGLYGYTNQYKVSTPAITIAARGTIGATFIRLEPFTPVVRLITIIPNDYIDIQFLYYLIKALNLGHTGTTIPQLTVPNIREKKFKFPDKKLQLELVSIFSQIDNKVNLLTANYEQTVTLCNDLKQSILKDIFG